MTTETASTEVIAARRPRHAAARRARRRRPRRRAARAAAAQRRPRCGALARIGVAIGVISLVTIVVGLIMPIGMFGFLAAVGLAIGIAALLGFMPSGRAQSPTAPAADLPNGAMVQRFDSYLYRSAPPCPRPRRRSSTRSARSCRRSSRRWSGSTTSIPMRRTRGG